eukprot:939036-Pyramimonas_sp.AAC.1
MQHFLHESITEYPIETSARKLAMTKRTAKVDDVCLYAILHAFFKARSAERTFARCRLAAQRILDGRTV